MLTSTLRRLRRRAAAALSVSAVLLMTACGSSGGTNGQQAATDQGPSLPERVTLIVPYSEGGGTDVWARFITPYLEKTVQGNPNFLVENKPGGESITGSNQFVQSGGNEGEQLLVTSGTTYYQYLLGRPEVKFDFTKMIPLMANGTGGVIYASKDSGITSPEQLKNPPKPLTYGGISATGLDLSLLLAFALFDVDVDATFGFEGRGPARQALERGEVNIDYQTTSAYKTQVEPLVKEGKVVPLMTFGIIDQSGEIVRDPNVPDLPTVNEVYEKVNGSEATGPAADAYKAFLAVGFAFNKGIWANAGTPESITRPIIDAAAAIAKDSDFNAKGEKVLGGYPLLSGSEASGPLAEAFQISPESRQFVVDLLKNEYDTTIESR